MLEQGLEMEDLSSDAPTREGGSSWLAEGLYWLLYRVVPAEIPRGTLRAYGKISV